MKLSEELKLLLSRNQDEQLGPLTIGQLFDRMGDRGFGFALLITSLPSALPIPAPGYSTPFGVLLMFLAVQILVGKPAPWIPNWFRSRNIPDKLADLMSKGSQKFFAKVEHLIHPRFFGFIRGPGRFLMGTLVFLMAFLMALPIPGTNTAPAGVIFLIGIAMTEEDGLLAILASILGVLAGLLYAAILTLIFYFGAGGVSEALQLIRQWLSSSGT